MRKAILINRSAQRQAGSFHCPSCTTSRQVEMLVSAEGSAAANFGKHNIKLRAQGKGKHSGTHVHELYEVLQLRWQHDAIHPNHLSAAQATLKVKACQPTCTRAP